MNNSEIDREEFLKRLKDIIRKYEYNSDYDRWLDSHVYDIPKYNSSFDHGFEKYYSSAYRYRYEPSLLFGSYEDTIYPLTVAQLGSVKKDISYEDLDACCDDIDSMLGEFAK